MKPHNECQPEGAQAFRHLTPAQRYYQAIRKARITAEREMREFMAGKRGWLECSADQEREFVIAEIGRAFEAGKSLASKPQP